jgi:hypothetical protein
MFIPPDWKDGIWNFRRQNVKRTGAERIQKEENVWTRTKCLKQHIDRHLPKVQKDFVITLRRFVRLG